MAKIVRKGDLYAYSEEPRIQISDLDAYSEEPWIQIRDFSRVPYLLFSFCGQIRDSNVVLSIMFLHK